MKDTDKVTLTVGQIKKLVKESVLNINDVIDDVNEQDNILREIENIAMFGSIQINKIISSKDDETRERDERTYESYIRKLINKIEELKKFDVIALTDANESINEDTEETITIPKNIGEVGSHYTQEQEDFMNWADEQFNGNVYYDLVSDEPDEVEGAQRDLDDWDIYSYSEQNAIDEDDFWTKLLESISENFEDGEIVPVSKMIDFIKKEGRNIAEEAFDEFEPDDDFLIHRGHWKSEAYWRS